VYSYRLEGDGIGRENVLECIQVNTRRRFHDRQHHHDDRVRPDVKEKLDRIANDTQRSKSFLAGEAVAAYVDRELEIIDGIKRGMADAAAGRVIPMRR
jgi:predicted transcriptional regulator